MELSCLLLSTHHFTPLRHELNSETELNSSQILYPMTSLKLGKRIKVNILFQTPLADGLIA